MLQINDLDLVAVINGIREVFYFNIIRQNDTFFNSLMTKVNKFN